MPKNVEWVRAQNILSMDPLFSEDQLGITPKSDLLELLGEPIDVKTFSSQSESFLGEIWTPLERTEIGKIPKAIALQFAT